MGLLRLFRGIPKGHPKYKKAKDGKAVPFGGHINPVQHRDGDTNSEFTSWTKSVKVAHDYATYDGQGIPTNGVVLDKLFDTRKNNVLDINTVGSGDVFDEKEHLVKGKVEGCNVHKVEKDSDWRELDRRLK